MHFTWFSRRDGVFSHELTVSCPERRSGEGRILWRVGENSHLSWKTMINVFSPPTCLCRSLVTQRSTGEQVSSPGKNWGYSPSKFNPSASTSGHPSKYLPIPMFLNLQDLAAHCMCHVKSPLTSWEHFMSHNIYYMSHTIDKWNVYCSYTIKCIFAGIRISRYDHAKNKLKNLHHSATFSLVHI